MNIVRQSVSASGYKLNMTNCQIINNYDIGLDIRNAQVVINNLTWAHWDGSPISNYITAYSTAAQASLKLTNSVFSYII